MSVPGPISPPWPFLLCVSMLAAILVLSLYIIKQCEGHGGRSDKPVAQELTNLQSLSSSEEVLLVQTVPANSANSACTINIRKGSIGGTGNWLPAHPGRASPATPSRRPGIGEPLAETRTTGDNNKALQCEPAFSSAAQTHNNEAVQCEPAFSSTAESPAENRTTSHNNEAVQCELAFSSATETGSHEDAEAEVAAALCSVNSSGRGSSSLVPPVLCSSTTRCSGRWRLEQWDRSPGLVLRGDSWQTASWASPAGLFLWRAAWFVYFSGIFIWEMWTQGLIQLQFYTEWSFVALICYLGMSASASATQGWSQKGKAATIFRGPLSFDAVGSADDDADVTLGNQRLDARCGATLGGYAHQILYQVVLTNALVVDCVLWLVLYPEAIRNHTTEDVLNFVSYNMHAVNLVALAGELAVNRMPFPAFRIAYCWLWACTYILVEWLLHGLGFRWSYGFLDTSRPTAPLWYLGLLIFLTACFFFFALLSRMKLWLDVDRVPDKRHSWWTLGEYQVVERFPDDNRGDV